MAALGICPDVQLGTLPTSHAHTVSAQPASSARGTKTASGRAEVPAVLSKHQHFVGQLLQAVTPTIAVPWPLYLPLRLQTCQRDIKAPAARCRPPYGPAVRQARCSCLGSGFHGCQMHSQWQALKLCKHGTVGRPLRVTQGAPEKMHVVSLACKIKFSCFVVL